MTHDAKQTWILAGYELFSKEGPKGLKVEVLARMLGKNKSSFYHYFADMEVFTEVLLDHHLKQAKIIAQRESLCPQVVPDLLNLLLEVKQDLLFNRQLRVHRGVESYRICLEKSSQEVGEAVLGIWAEMLGLGGHSSLALMVLKLSLENFYLQITEENLTYQWLLDYVNELKMMVRAFQNNELKNSIA